MNISDELKEKFENLFTDKETEDAFFEWQKSKDNGKVSWWGKYGALLIPCAAVILFFKIIIFSNRDRVDQEVFKFDDGTKYCTWVWINDEIAKSWLTPIDNITDSAINEQKKEGERLLKTVDK